MIFTETFSAVFAALKSCALNQSHSLIYLKVLLVILEKTI